MDEDDYKDDDLDEFECPWCGMLYEDEGYDEAHEEGCD